MRLMYKSFFILFFLFFFSCERVPLHSNSILPQVSGCQNCHQSPPLTGNHGYHLFKQTRRKQITCDECHATAVSAMLWTYMVKKKPVTTLKKWDQADTTRPQVRIILHASDTSSYPLCFTKMKDDTLFLKELAYIVHAVPDSLDSIYTSYDSLYWYRYDSSYLAPDTIAPDLVIMREVKTYTLATAYNSCLYQYVKGAIMETMVANDYGQVLGNAVDDLIISRGEINRRFLISPDYSITDTLYGLLIPLDSDFFSQSSPEPSQVIRVYDTTTFQADTAIRIYIDTAFYSISGDTLYSLYKDSVMEFGDNIFADNTSQHINGSVDISFLHEPVTLYSEDTIDVVNDSITGEVVEYIIRPAGAWAPERKSCWSSGIEAAQCHDAIIGETFWYLPEDTL